MPHLVPKKAVCPLVLGPIMVIWGDPLKNSRRTEGAVISLLWCGVSPSLHPVKSPLPEMTHPQGS